MKHRVSIWQADKAKYVPYDLPDGAVIIANSGDEITCAKCGKKIKYDTSYCSRNIHNELGIGYAVCSDCYAKELVERGAENVWF